MQACASFQPGVSGALAGLPMSIFNGIINELAAGILVPILPGL